MTATRRRPGRPQVHDGDEILDAAARALVRRGYSALRYADVAAESGVPVPSLQHRFRSLDHLRREALLRKVRLELEETQAALIHVADAWEWIVAMIDRSVSLRPETRQRGWGIWVEYLHAAAHDSAIARDFKEVDALWLAALEEIVASGERMGRLHPQLPPREAATLVQGLIDGLGMPLSADRSDEDADEILRLLVAGARVILRPDATGPTV
jgi:AcrR family transcriptional regulator